MSFPLPGTIRKRRSKYGAIPTALDGIQFDSKGESQRFAYLRLREMAHEISDLRCHVRYDLIPNQRRDDGTLERPVWYEADFVYQENGKTIVEDFKSSSTRTDSYVIKRKLMLSVHGISIIEVTK